MLLPIGGDGRQLASADVLLVLRAGMARTPGAAQMAAPAADEAAQ